MTLVICSIFLLFSIYLNLLCPANDLPKNNNNRTTVKQEIYYQDINSISREFRQFINPIKNDKERMLDVHSIQKCVDLSRSFTPLTTDAEGFVAFCLNNEDLNLSVYRLKWGYYILPIYVKDLFKSIGMGYETDIKLKSSIKGDRYSIYVLSDIDYYVVDNMVYLLQYAPIAQRKQENDRKQLNSWAESNRSNEKIIEQNESIYTNFLNLIKNTIATIKKYDRTAIIIHNKEMPIISFLKIYFLYLSNLFYHKRDYAKIVLDMSDMFFSKTIFTEFDKKTFFTKTEKRIALIKETRMYYFLTCAQLYIYIIYTVDDDYFLVPARLLHDHKEYFDVDNFDIDNHFLFYKYKGDSQNFKAFLKTVCIDDKGFEPNKMLSRDALMEVKYYFYDKFSVYEEKNGITRASFDALDALNDLFVLDYYDDLDSWQKKILGINSSLYIVKYKNSHKEEKSIFSNRKILEYCKYSCDNKTRMCIIDNLSRMYNLNEDDFNSINNPSHSSWYSKLKNVGYRLWSSIPSYVR